MDEHVRSVVSDLRRAAESKGTTHWGDADRVDVRSSSVRTAASFYNAFVRENRPAVLRGVLAPCPQLRCLVLLPLPGTDGGVLVSAEGVARLDISKYSWISEADHGLLKWNSESMPTAFPQAIALAATLPASAPAGSHQGPYTKQSLQSLGAAQARAALALRVVGLDDGRRARRGPRVRR